MICLKSLLETLQYQNLKMQLEMNWKAKSHLKNVKTFLVLLNRKNLQEMMDLRGNSITAFLICSDVTL